MAKDKRGNGSDIIPADAGTSMEMVEHAEGEFSLAEFNKMSDASNMIERITQAHLEWAASQGLIGEKVIVLKAGMLIRGKFLGEGPSMTLHNRQQVNKETGEIGPPTVRTWRLLHQSGNVIRFLSNYQLDREMPEVKIGQTVQIIHGGQVDTGNGQRVNNMLVQYPRTNALDELAAKSQTGQVIEASAS